MRGSSGEPEYEFIDAEYAAVPKQDEAPTVTQMCEWLDVSRSGFYDWRSRPESETEKSREMLKLMVKALFEANNDEYGYRRVHAALVRGGVSVMTSLSASSCASWAWCPASPGRGGAR